MSARNYDFTVTVANAYNFKNGNIVYGVSTGAIGQIANVNTETNQLKIKVNNSTHYFSVGETLRSNVTNMFENNSFVDYWNFTTTNVGGTDYIINGVNNAFPIPGYVGTISKDHIRVYLNNIVLPSEVYNYPYDNGTHANCIQFLPISLINQEVYEAEAIDSGEERKAWISGSLLPTVKKLITSIFPVANGYISATTRSPARFIPVEVTWTLLTGQDLNTGPSLYIIPTANTFNIRVQVVSGNTQVKNMLSTYYNNSVVTAESNVVAIDNSKFIREKNAFEQKPLVRLYTVYYPGEWYAPNENGNPAHDGEGYAWPSGFPYRFAEIRGDVVSDISYAVRFGGTDYIPYPIGSSGISTDSMGKINELNLTISNFDNLITTIVEDPFLAGNVTSNSCQGIVNGELVYGLDPRTVVGNIHYDQGVVDTYYGKTNAAWIYSQAISNGETWEPLKMDTRDLLGGVVEVRTTFANFLDYWPEYSVIDQIYGNAIVMVNNLPYRPGDIVGTNANAMSEATCVVQEVTDAFIRVSNPEGLEVGRNLYIQNIDASPDDFVLDKFKVNNLDGLDDRMAKFTLTSWLQYFKLQIPKRKYFKNTCPWVYKGPECAYPSSGSGIIPGSFATANGFFNARNETVFTQTQDVCAKNYDACVLRANEERFGAFIASQLNITA